MKSCRRLNEAQKLQKLQVRNMGRSEAVNSPVVREFAHICGEIPSRLFMATMCKKYLGFRPSRMGFKRMISFVQDVAQRSHSLVDLMQTPDIRRQISAEYTDYRIQRRLFPLPQVLLMPLPPPVISDQPLEQLDFEEEYPSGHWSDISESDIDMFTSI
jgi:hypothetical protein